MKTVVDWLAYLEENCQHRIHLGLERVQQVAKKLDLSYFTCPVITVGGTNGKGSVVATLEKIYLSAGYRVGCFTSPYFFKLNEQIHINGVEINDEQLLAGFQTVALASEKVTLTRFEFITLVALWCLQQASLAVIILEVGLGGRLDAVNMVEPDLSIITSVAMDHMEWLGKDRESIGKEKAGIFRYQKPAICGDAAPPNSIKTIVEQLAVDWYCQDQQFYYLDQGTHWDWHGPRQQFTGLPLPKVLLTNAATAIMAITVLQDRLPVSLRAIHSGLQQVQLSGRLQVLTQPVLTLLDVAHNPAASKKLADYLLTQPIDGRNLAVFGMLADKQIAETAAPLLDIIDCWYIGGLSVTRGASAQLIWEKLQTFSLGQCYNFETVEQAYQQACRECGSRDRIVVLGSFHTVAVILAALTS